MLGWIWLSRYGLGKPRIPNLRSYDGGGRSEGQNSQVVLKVVPRLGLGLEAGFISSGSRCAQLVTQVLSGETRFLRIRAYPEKIGAEAPEQPQNSRQSEKRGIFLSALALAAGAKQAGGGYRTTAGRLRDRRITTQLLRR